MAQSDEKNINSIDLMIEQFNKILDKIIKTITNGSLTPENFDRLTTKIYELIGFIKRVIFPLLSSFNANSNVFDENASSAIDEIKKMLYQMFDNVEKTINDTQSNLTKDGKIDVDSLKKYLEFIGVLMNNLFYIVVSTISYATGNMSEEEYDEAYREFKYKLEENKKVFHEKFE